MVEIFSQLLLVGLTPIVPVSPSAPVKKVRKRAHSAEQRLYRKDKPQNTAKLDVIGKKKSRQCLCVRSGVYQHTSSSLNLTGRLAPNLTVHEQLIYNTALIFSLTR